MKDGVLILVAVKNMDGFDGCQGDVAGTTGRTSRMTGQIRFGMRLIVMAIDGFQGLQPVGQIRIG